jgi:hypothetical protein
MKINLSNLLTMVNLNILGTAFYSEYAFIILFLSFINFLQENQLITILETLSRDSPLPWRKKLRLLFMRACIQGFNFVFFYTIVNVHFFIGNVDNFSHFEHLCRSLAAANKG